MKTSKIWLAALFLVMTAGFAGAQSQPKDLPWAVAEFQGDGDWPARLPILLVRTWDNLPVHQVTAGEKTALRKAFLEETRRSLDKQVAQLKLDLDKKRLQGPLPSTEPDATNKSLADLKTKLDLVAAGTVDGADAPEALVLRSVWSPGADHLPWKVLDRRDLGAKTQALYLVTGRVRMVGTYLSVSLDLYSTIEEKILGTWEGNFAPDEAGDRMAEASDQLKESLLGRPWASLSVNSSVPGARIQAWRSVHVLPWSSDDLSPGSADIVVEYPGRPPVRETVVLKPGTRTVLDIPAPTGSPDMLLLETDPPGAFLYVDSQYVGPSPQTIARPFATTRIRAQSPGWETLTWEIEPNTVSPSLGTLVRPGPHPSVADTKDRFYFSLAAFSFSFTTTVFLGAWSSEQINLVNAYAVAGAADGYNTAMGRFNIINNSYGVGIGLTSALAIWMIFFTLQDYLNAAQASLP